MNTFRSTSWRRWAVGAWTLALAAVCGSAAPVSVQPAKQVCCSSPEVAVFGEAPAYWEEGFEAVYRTLLKNLHGANRFSKVRYAYPSPIFRGIYLWDTAFISQVWRTWDVQTAEDVNWAALSRADASGRLPHFSSVYAKSEHTQPPVMAWSVWRNYERSGNRDYLARAYPILKRYNEWLYRERRLPCGLFFWIHRYESGIDNSPRFGSADEKEVVDMRSLAAIDLNAYLVRQNRTLALIAAELGLIGEAAVFEEKAEDLTGLVNATMWDPETGLYYDLDTSTGTLNKIKTIASLLPLFAGIPDEARAAALMLHIMNEEEFNTRIPFPSVSRDDPAFEKDCWRGPVWVNTAYVVIVGMEEYGYREEAARLAWKLVDGVYRTYRNTGRIVEFYDPDRFDLVELHRKRGNLLKQVTLGSKPRPHFVGWTGLVNTLLVEHLIGYRTERGEHFLAPNLPAEANGARLALAVPDPIPSGYAVRRLVVEADSLLRISNSLHHTSVASTIDRDALELRFPRDGFADRMRLLVGPEDAIRHSMAFEEVVADPMGQMDSIAEAGPNGNVSEPEEALVRFGEAQVQIWDGAGWIAPEGSRPVGRTASQLLAYEVDLTGAQPEEVRIRLVSAPGLEVACQVGHPVTDSRLVAQHFDPAAER